MSDKSQAYFWAEKRQDNERKANEDINSGRMETFDSAQELFKDLG
ncbi:MAG: hypothetical protein PHF74_04035 [Dehalococcoidales bacterium]|nr:hypothetical protein [Dehalococcoidales bacterium]